MVRKLEYFPTKKCLRPADEVIPSVLVPPCLATLPQAHANVLLRIDKQSRKKGKFHAMELEVHKLFKVHASGERAGGDIGGQRDREGSWGGGRRDTFRNCPNDEVHL